MFEPGNIVLGFAKKISDPKNKYVVSIYRDEECEILLHFTTSQPRAGVPIEDVHHGIIRKDDEYVSYVFEAKREIGTNPETGTRFSFPKQTTMSFDYGLLKGTEQKLLTMFDNPRVVCKLDEKEYINLVYAMYRSSRTPIQYKPHLEKVLDNYYSQQASE